MKTVNYSFIGGMPLSQNVIEWSANGLKDAVNALCGMAYTEGTGLVAITGCVYDATTNDISAGWIYNGTELCYFPGGNTVTAGTDKIKIVETNGSVIFENAASRPIYVTREFAFDATGVSVTTIKPAFTKKQSFTISMTAPEVDGALFVTVDISARTMRFEGSFETTSASTLGSNGIEIKLIDDTDLKNDLGALYPNRVFQFLSAVMPLPGNSGLTEDVNNHPIETIPLRHNNAGLFAYLRKTTSDEYTAYFDHTFSLI